LMLFFYLVLPFGLQQSYQNNRQDFFKDITEKTTLATQQQKTTPAKILTSQQVNAIIIQQWGAMPAIDLITVDAPNTSTAKILIKQQKDTSITMNPTQLSIHGATGKVLGNTRNRSTGATIYGGVSGLHMALFAQPVLRLALFTSGLLGCMMIASGMLLWSLKRQIQNKNPAFHLGHYLVDRLNIATCIGLPLAVISYFYANRVWTLNHETNYEIKTFFFTWLLSLVWALATPKFYLWRSQLALFIFLTLMLPILDISILFYNGWLQSWQDLQLYLSIDLFFWIFSALGYFIYKNIHPIQQQAQKRIIQKIHKKQKGEIA
ncbi:MAG: PepSY-associated TM helix domain-containing protein, partial [Acinetobacter sp.]